MKEFLLNQALNHAFKNLKKHPELNNFPHWSFVVVDSKIISTGVNQKTSPPKYFGYHNLIDPTFIPKYHSELRAIKKAKIKNSFSLINVRLNKFGEIKNSMPCLKCKNILIEFNCKTVFYSTELGWQKLRLN